VNSKNAPKVPSQLLQSAASVMYCVQCVGRFCYPMGCGCVFSDRALKEIKDSICVNVSTLIDCTQCIRFYVTFASIICNITA